VAKTMRMAVDSDIFLYAVIDHNRDELKRKEIFPRDIKNF
jgi:hypothetical protein